MAMDSIGSLLTGGAGMEPIPGDYNAPAAQYQTPAAATVTDPNEIQKNKGLWANFLARLNDPNVRQALIVTGANLMRSPQLGQNNWDVAGNALTAGVGTLQQLRERDRLQKNFEAQQAAAASERADTRAQRNVENQQNQQRINISGQQQQTYAQSVAQQGEASRSTQARENAQAVEQARHNRATEAIQGLAAQADMARAKAYSSVGNKTPAEIQKINILAQKFMQEDNLDEVSARAKALMIVDSTGTAKSPGEQARTLYTERLKAWGNDISNIGKTLTPQQAQELLDASIQDVMKLQTFNAQAMGQPPASTDRSGPIQRNTGPVTPGETPVGGVVRGYKKTKQGPDNVKENWTKVQNGQ